MNVSAFVGEIPATVSRGVSSVTGIAMAVLLTTGLAQQAEAATVTIDDKEYKISLLEGTFDSLETALRDQVWWGDDNLADDFADALGGALGFPNPPTTVSPLGPMFAWAAGSTQFRFESVTTTGASGGFLFRSDTYTFAIGEELAPVPLPATLPLLFVGAGALAMMRRRRKPT